MTGDERAASPIAREGAIRFIVDALGFALGGVGAVITTRHLGPAGQGTFAVITLICSITILLASCGLGEAAVVRVTSGEWQLRTASGSTVGALIITGLVGGLVAATALVAIVGPTNGKLWASVALAALDVPVTVVMLGLMSLLNAQLRVRASSGVSAVLSITTAAGLLVLVAVMSLGIPGAVLSGVLASYVGLVAVVVLLLRGHVDLKPRLNQPYLRAAMRYGIRAQAVAGIVAISNRVDVLLVYELAGPSQAGRYSVALTLGALASMVPYSLSIAMFPRLGAATDEAAWGLVERAFRAGLLVAIGAAAAIAGSASTVIPAILGDQYRPSAVPAAILAGGAVAVSAQWTLGRARAARGSPGLLVRSFSASLGVMLVLDIALVPSQGEIGAAIASASGAAVGLVVSLAGLPKDVARKNLIPRTADLAFLSQFIRSPLRRIRGS